MNAVERIPLGVKRLGVGLTSPLGGANKVVERLLGLGPAEKGKTRSYESVEMLWMPRNAL